MGLLYFLANISGVEDEEKKRNEKLFKDEAEVFGMTEEEMEEAKRSGITPEEWVEDDEDNLDDF